MAAKSKKLDISGNRVPMGNPKIPWLMIFFPTFFFTYTTGLIPKKHPPEIHNMDMFMEDFSIFPMFPIVSIISPIDSILFPHCSMIFLMFSQRFWSTKSRPDVATAASDKDGQLVVPIRSDLPGNTEAADGM